MAKSAVRHRPAMKSNEYILIAPVCALVRSFGDFQAQVLPLTTR